MSDTTSQAAPQYDAHPFDLGALLKLLGIGVICGVIGWLLYLGLAHYFIVPVFCRNADTFSVCNNGGTIAWVSAHIIVMAAAVAVLARMAFYRPLLIVLGTFAALWGAHSWLGPMDWYMGILWQAILFGVAMMAFGWLARASNFLAASLSTIVLVVLARVVLMLT